MKTFYRVKIIIICFTPLAQRLQPSKIIERWREALPRV